MAIIINVIIIIIIIVIIINIRATAAMLSCSCDSTLHAGAAISPLSAASLAGRYVCRQNWLSGGLYVSIAGSHGPDEAAKPACCRYRQGKLVINNIDLIWRYLSSQKLFELFIVPLHKLNYIFSFLSCCV